MSGINNLDQINLSPKDRLNRDDFKLLSFNEQKALILEVYNNDEYFINVDLYKFSFQILKWMIQEKKGVFAVLTSLLENLQSFQGDFQEDLYNLVLESNLYVNYLIENLYRFEKKYHRKFILGLIEKDYGFSILNSKKIDFNQFYDISADEILELARKKALEKLNTHDLNKNYDLFIHDIPKIEEDKEPILEEVSLINKLKKFFRKKHDEVLEIEPVSFDFEVFIKDCQLETNRSYSFIINLIRELFSDIENWEYFFSKELKYNNLRHYELLLMISIYKSLECQFSKEFINNLLINCYSENDTSYDLCLKFLKAGSKKLIDLKESNQCDLFEIESQSKLWENDLSKLSIDEYLELCSDRNVSSGRFLVHSVKDDLIEDVLRRKFLRPSALLHIEDPKVSEFLDKNRFSKKGFNQTFGVSIGSHFSFDNKIMYSSASFAFVFAAESIFNNYSFLETHVGKENDIVIGPKDGSYLDSNFCIDVLKHGFVLMPLSLKDEIEVSDDLRVFYYKGRTVDQGMKELREKILEPESKVKLKNQPKLNYSFHYYHSGASNSSYYAKTAIWYNFKMFEKYKDVEDKFNLSVLEGPKQGGLGNYFSV